jgi:hypothetical protein
VFDWNVTKSEEIGRVSLTAEEIDATDDTGPIDREFTLEVPPGRKKTQGKIRLKISKIPPMLPGIDG